MTTGHYDPEHWLDTFAADLACISGLSIPESQVVQSELKSEDKEVIYRNTERLSDLGVPVYAWIADFFHVKPAVARRNVLMGCYDSNGTIYSIVRVIKGASTK